MRVLRNAIRSLGFLIFLGCILLPLFILLVGYLGRNVIPGTDIHRRYVNVMLYSFIVWISFGIGQIFVPVNFEEIWNKGKTNNKRVGNEVYEVIEDGGD